MSHKQSNVFGNRGSYHCDLKPANILVGASNYLVVDLGLAKYLNQPGITVTGMVMGTYGYMAPEQLKGRRYLTSSADVFALGIIAYEAVVGFHPFLGRQQFIGLRVPEDPRLTIPDINERLRDLLAKMLAFDPVRRPTADQVLKTVEYILLDISRRN